MLISGYTSPWDLLREELNQRKEEGFLIPAELTAEFDGLDPEKDAWNEAAIAGLYAKLEACRRDPAFPFEEPNGLDEIRACRPERRKLPELRLSDDELLDKFHGAWLAARSAARSASRSSAWAWAANAGRTSARC